MIRTIALLLLSVAAILFLAGCSQAAADFEEEFVKEQKSDSQRQVDDGLYESPIVLEDGRTVTCVVYSSGYRGGLSCDWGN